MALRILERVERTRAYADRVLRAALGRSSLAPVDRALVTALVQGTLRWRGRLDFVLSHVLDRELAKLEPAVRSALRLGAYQILFAERIPDRAAVDEMVRCVRAGGLERAVGLTNAVLRRLAAEGRAVPLPSLEEDPLGHLTHALSLPAWLAERWIERWGPAEAAALAAASNALPPRCVRANPQRTTPAALLAELRARLPDAQPGQLAPGALLLGSRGDPRLDPAFAEGRFTLQDEASQLVVDLLDPQPGERVLDACAAPGTKATAAAERVGASGAVLALDRHARRLALAARDARRLGLGNLAIRECDVTSSLPEEVEGSRWDRVLVDAPCSGLGTLRRHPDLRWRLDPRDPETLGASQLAILRGAARALRPGGVLVYSVCTFEPEETDAVVEAFLAAAPDFRRAPRASLPAQLAPALDMEGSLRTLPHRHDTDGFFAVRLERTS